MALAKGPPEFVSHFTCTKCDLGYREHRSTYLVKECCPLCDTINYAVTWSFTVRHLALQNIHNAIKTLAEDVAYAVYDEKALFPDPPRTFHATFEVDTLHWRHSLECYLAKKKRFLDHE